MNNLKDVHVSIEETTKAETVDITSLCFIVNRSSVEIKPFMVYDTSYQDQLKKLKEENPVMGDLIDFAEEKLKIAFSTQANLRKGSLLLGFSKDGAGDYPLNYEPITSKSFKDEHYHPGNTDAQFVIQLAKDGLGTVDYTAKDKDGKAVNESNISISWIQTPSLITVTFPQVGKTAFILKLKRVPDLRSFIDEYNLVYALNDSYSIDPDKQNWVDFFSEREINNEKFFGFLAILDDVKSMVSYEDLVLFCNGQTNPIFLCDYINLEDINHMIKSELHIPFIHKQNLLGKEVQGMLMEIALPILCYRLSINPNVNTYTTLTGTASLESNTFSIPEREMIEKAHINQYLSRNGLTRFRLGVTASGRKIEEIFCIKSFIPYDMKERLEVFQDNNDLKQGDVGQFRTVLNSILSSYEEAQILTITKLLNNKSYEITSMNTKIVDNIAEFEANIKICYNGNIVNINIIGKEIEVVL